MVENKKKNLDAILKELNSFVVAFSGGVDSSFLLFRAHSLKKTKMIGVTIRTPYIPEIELEEAVEFARLHGINHRIIDLSFPEAIRSNPVDRCYLCKKTLFSKLLDFAEENGFKYVIDGTNADDTNVYRPGLRASAGTGHQKPSSGSRSYKKRYQGNVAAGRPSRRRQTCNGLPSYKNPVQYNY